MDFVDEAAGPGARISVELSAASAAELVRAIQAALATEQARRDLVATAGQPLLSSASGEPA